MATPLTATAFLSALRAEGLSVVEVGSWRTHNRNAKGSWGPVNGVMVHHTVTSGTSKTVQICKDGYSGLPGPLCHGVIGKDGTVYLVGMGRANHAGGGDVNVLNAVVAESYATNPPATHKGEGDSGAVDGNSRFYGFECENLGDGRDPWTVAQIEAIVRATAAVCRAHQWGAKSVIGHLEWSDQKSDPRGVAMASIRTLVAERLKHSASWSLGGSTTYTVKKGDTLSSIARAKLGYADRYKDIVALNHLADPNAIKVGQVLHIPQK
ncbi:N-acetylmuramoyl-L-alanine amidase [Streptomyces sp. NPDC059080]|uniref:LysM peptidoglycan-binding domain-containing protein n=1 Tax=Streptomyces sp. NPDC059080 TaxID=3346718 RepID=UPI003687872B